MDKQAVNVWIEFGRWGQGPGAAFVMKVVNILVEHCSLRYEMSCLWHFEGTYYLNSERPSWYIWPLRMKLTHSSETSVNTHPKTRCRISETRNSPLRCCDNLKPRLLCVPQRPSIYCNCLGDSPMLSTHSGPSVERCLTCCIAFYPAGGSSCSECHIWLYVIHSESRRHCHILVLHP
jgi:hypothetical protein